METTPLSVVSSSQSSSPTSASIPPPPLGGIGLDDDGGFICNICLEITHKDPVVTQCGHLYCWPCLYRWLNTHHSTCPVCKAGVTNDNIIPLFIKGVDQDPRLKTQRNISSSSTGGGNNNSQGVGTNSTDYGSVPSRPVGRRPEPTNTGPGTGFNTNNNQFNGMSYSVGFGFFPSLFGLQFQCFSSPPAHPDRPHTPEEIEQEKLSKVMFAFGVVVIIALLIL